MYVITDGAGYWLAGLTKSQDGQRRVWSPDLTNALKWDTYQQALEIYNDERFVRYPRPFIERIEP